jgi:GT2 family glycosyltransferase
MRIESPQEHDPCSPEGADTTRPAPKERSAPALPAASLVVCSRNRPEMLLAVVESVLTGDELPAELVIVDQSDAPHATLAQRGGVRDCEVRYLWSTTIGLCRANNIGMREARHEIVAFTHDDVLATPTWFGSLVRALVAAGRSAVVTGRVLPSAPETPGAFAPSTRVDETPSIVQGRTGAEILHPMNMAMYRDAVERAGGFDERIGPGTPFPGGEDHDLEFRLRDAGYRIHYVPEAVVYHRAWREAGDYLPVRWRYGRGQGAYYAKHLRRDDSWMLKRMRGDLAHRGLRFLRRLPRQPRLALGDLLFSLGMLSAVAEWLLLHRHRPDTA